MSFLGSFSYLENILLQLLMLNNCVGVVLVKDSQFYIDMYSCAFSSNYHNTYNYSTLTLLAFTHRLLTDIEYHMTKCHHDLNEFRPTLIAIRLLLSANFMLNMQHFRQNIT